MSLLKYISILFLFSHSLLAEETSIEPLNVYFDSDTPLITNQGEPTPSAEYITSSMAFLDKHGLPYQVIRLPWSRIKRLAETENNVLLQELIRTEVREEQFFWLHRLRSIDYYLFSRQQLSVDELNEKLLKSGQFTAVCERDSAQCNMLQRFGIPENNIIQVQDAKDGRLADMLVRERADLLLTSKTRMAIYAADAGLQISQFKILMHAKRIHVYLAAAKTSLTTEYASRLEALNQPIPVVDDQ